MRIMALRAPSLGGVGRYCSRSARGSTEQQDQGTMVLEDSGRYHLINEDPRLGLTQYASQARVPGSVIAMSQEPIQCGRDHGLGRCTVTHQP